MPDNCSPLKTGTKPHMILPPAVAKSGRTCDPARSKSHHDSTGNLIENPEPLTIIIDDKARRNDCVSGSWPSRWN